MRILVSLLAYLALFGAWLFWDEVPRLQGNGVVSLPMETVATNLASAHCLSDGDIVELRGDSHVIGARMEGDIAAEKLPYGRIMQQKLDESISVLIRGRGGFTAEMAELELQDLEPKGDIVMLALGTNDAAPRGWLTRKRPVALEVFEASLKRQISHEAKRGAIVMLIAPPPGGSVAINKRLKPYREAVRSIGLSNGLAVIDPSDAFASCTQSEPLLTSDALHLNTAGHHCLGNFIAEAICPKD